MGQTGSRKQGRIVYSIKVNKNGGKSKQVRIHDRNIHVRWTGALMEVRSFFCLNSVVKKTRDGPTDGPTDQPMDGRTDRPMDGRTDRQTLL